MECMELLEVMPVTQSVSIMDGMRELSCSEASRVALELPNCVLERHVERVLIGETVGGDPVVEIILGAIK